MTTHTFCHLLGAFTLIAMCENAGAHDSTSNHPIPGVTHAVSVLDHGDVEGVGFAFENGKWDLYIDDHLHNVGYEPGAAIVRVLDTARTQVPADATYSFLGAAGTPVWLLPQSTDEASALGVVSLGYSAEGIAPGTFTGDITLQLTDLDFTPEPGVPATGHFALFTNDALGSPTVLFNSRDGLSAADAVTIAAGAHRHFNWAFSQAGLYKLTYKVSATRNAALVTDTQTFTYRVRLPDSPLTLWSVGETLVVNGSAARIAALGLPAMHGNTRAAVRATLAGTGITAASNSTILLREHGDITLLARTGGAAPGLAGSKFKSFGDPASSGAGLISFAATLVAGSGGVIGASDSVLLSQYAAGGGGTSLGIVWREGAAAPGAASFRFTRLNWFFPSGDGFILSAQATNGRSSGNGVWHATFTSGVPVLTLLIMEGKPFLSDQALKKPSAIALPTTAPQPGGTARAIATDGTVALLVRFTDGSREIIQFSRQTP